MYMTTITGGAGDRWQDAQGRSLILIGNDRLCPGRVVWTDGRYCYSSVQMSDVPPIKPAITAPNDGILFLERADDGIYLSVIFLRPNDFEIKKKVRISSNRTDLSCSIICENNKSYIMLNYVVYDMRTGKQVAVLPPEMRGSVYRDMAIADNGDLHCVVETQDARELHAVRNNAKVNHILFSGVDWRKLVGANYDLYINYFGVYRMPSILPDGTHYLYGGINFALGDFIYDSSTGDFTKFNLHGKFVIDDYHNDNFYITSRENTIKVGGYNYRENGDGFANQILSVKQSKKVTEFALYSIIDTAGIEIIKDGKKVLRNGNINFYNNSRLAYTKNIGTLVAIVGELLGEA